MSKIDIVNNSRLAKAVEKRQKFLTKVVSFIEELLIENGEVTKCVTYSAHTHQFKRLSGFSNFTFEVDSGQTMFGGTSVRIYYRYGDIRHLVLSLYYQTSVEECSVLVFFDKCNWGKALERVMKRKNMILAKMQKREQTISGLLFSASKEASEDIELQANAKRLGLN